MDTFEVTRGGLINYGGEPFELRAGAMIDSTQFDVVDLRRQGVVLRRLLSVAPERPCPGRGATTHWG